MLRANDDFFNRLSLCDVYDVSPSPLIDDDADPPVVPSMGHASMNGWIGLYHYPLSKFILVKNLAEADLSSFSGLFS